MLKSPPAMGFYYAPSWMALLGMRDLVHGPRPEQNHPAPTELIQRLWQDAGALSVARWSPSLWLPVPWPR
jgi:hypothetical protein